MNTTNNIHRAITAAVLAAGIIIQTPGFTAQQYISSDPISSAISINSSSTASADPKAVVHKSWRETMAKISAPQEGCSHASYPNYVWEKVDCKATPQDAQVPMQIVGNGQDYGEISNGLIQGAKGTFEVSNVTSVKTTGAGCTYWGFVCSGVNGNGQYSLQLNTNNNAWTSACLGGNSTCKVWQQFLYVAQFQYDSVLNTVGLDNSPGLYIQFWMIDYGSHCPKHWRSVTVGGQANCVLNSGHVSPPYVPVSELGDVNMQAAATPGGKDIVEFFYDGEGWSVTDDDNTLQIGSVWRNAEFNVFGNGGGSEAVFNTNASINVELQLEDGTHSNPLCSSLGGTTGETNSLILRACSTSVVNGYPTINFTEQDLSVIIHSPGPIGNAPVISNAD